MRYNLPSIQTLLAFEAAARHLNFTKASQELNLTQAAISHQIKNLEHLLGIKLFVRQRNTLTLTSAARDYLHSISEAINLVASATEITRKDKQTTALNIVCLPTYATQCLIPALPEFQRLYPHITVNLLLGSEFSEFDRANYDVAIRYGTGKWAASQSELLHNEEFFPVCAPHLLPQGSFTERQLLPLLPQIRTYFYSMYQDDWPAWLKAAGHSGVQFSSTSVFHMQLASLEAAAAGSGLAIGRTPLVERYLASGAIVAPFKTRVKSESAYFLTSPSSRAALQKVKLFRNWALERLGEKTVKLAVQAQDSSPYPLNKNKTGELGYKPLARLLSEWRSRSPDKYAIVDISRDRRITFSELATLVDTSAHQLRAQGVGSGDRVIVFMADSLEKIIIWLALWRLAAVVCPLDLSRLRFTTAASVCTTLDPQHIVCDTLSETAYVPSSMLSLILRVGELEESNEALKTHHDISFTTQLGEVEALPEGAKSDDIAAICSTSGTTGEPKLIVYDHATYWLNGQAIIERLALTPNDRMLEYRSFDWTSVQILSLMPFLQTGLTLHVAPQFSLSRFPKWVAKYQLSVSVGIPTVINLLLQKPESISIADLASLRYITCSTAPLPIGQWVRFEQIFRIRLLNIYGSSEAGWICSNRSDNMQIGTVGYPMPGVDINIVNDLGHSCATNVAGHVMVQGSTLALGLLQSDGKIEAIRGKRLSTNDLGFIDQSGCVHITGRVDDVINRGGVKIYPRDIEDALLANPEVLDAAVVGAPDDIYGQSPVCFFIPRSSISENELLAYCKRTLPRELIPTAMVRLKKLPRNARGKLVRSVLLEEWQSTYSKLIKHETIDQ